MKKVRKLGAALVAVLLIAGVVHSQTNTTEILGRMIFRYINPTVDFAGTLTFQSLAGTDALTLTDAGVATFTGAVGAKATVASAASGTTAITAAQSGGVFVNTGTSATTTFTLPAAAAGLRYCFVEAGDAAGELLVGVTGTNTVVGKTHGAENGTGIATAASTGIKNTAATNVKGDFACLVALDTSTWLMTAVAGVWASR